MIKSVLFDLDDTILDFKKSESAAIQKALKKIGVEPTDDIAECYSRINKSQWLLLERQEITREELLTRRFDILFERLGVDYSSADMKSIYEKFLSEGHFFMPYAKETLEALSPLYDLYIVSNGTAQVQNGRIKSSGIAKYFKGIFISEYMGCNKPQKAFFDKCFASVPSLNKENAIIIGDSLTSDIIGGNNAGIPTCWYNPDRITNKTAAKPDFEIASLRELPRLLESLRY